MYNIICYHLFDSAPRGGAATEASGKALIDGHMIFQKDANNPLSTQLLL